MAKELLSDVNDLIISKDSIVSILQHNHDGNVNYRAQISLIEKKINSISSTLTKYDDLIKKAGVNTQDLKYALRQDFLNKAATLENAKHLMPNNYETPIDEVKKNMIIYFKTCANILRNTQRTLKDFIND